MSKGSLGRKIVFIGSALLVLTFAVAAVPALAANDARVSAVTAEAGSTAPSASTTYTVGVTTNQTLAAGTSVNFRFQYSSCPWNLVQDFTQCQFDLSGVAFAGLPGEFFGGGDSAGVNLAGSLPAGTYPVTFTGVVNPSFPGLVKVGVQTRAPGDEDPCADVPPGEMCEQDNTWSGAVYLGQILVKGRVSMPNGSPVQNGGVNVVTEDWSWQMSANTDSNGDFAAGAISVPQNKELFIELWADPQAFPGFIAPGRASLGTYDGTPKTKNLQLIAAVKKIKAQVRYADDAPVTDGQLGCWNTNGGGWASANTDASGNALISVSPGSWECNLSPMWDPETNQQASVNWSFSAPPKGVSFGDNTTPETKTVRYEVLEATARVKGTVNFPDGSAVEQGWIEVRNQEGLGSGGSLNNGRFDFAVPSGTYKLNMWLDSNQFPQFYFPERKFSIAEEETKAFGTITLGEKTARVTGTVREGGANTAAAAVGDPAEGVSINMWARNCEDFGFTQTNAQGNYTLYLVPDCEHEIMVQQAFDGEGPNWIPTTTKPVVVTVGENQTRRDIDFTVAEADATVNVSVVDQNGEAVTDLWGWVFARKGGCGFGPGCEFGTGLQRGTATVSLFGGATYTIGMHMPPESGGMSLEEEVEVRMPVNGTKNVTLTIIPNDAEIVGQMKDQNGRVIRDADCEVFAMDDNFGWFPARLSEGSYALSVRGGRNYSIGFWCREGSDILNSHPQENFFTVPMNGRTTKILTAFRADTYVDVTLKDPNGDPIDFAWVGASNFRFLEDKLTGDFDSGRAIDTGTECGGGGCRLPLVSGAFELFAGLPPGVDYLPPADITVDVTPNNPGEVTMNFREADGNVNVTAVLEDGSTPDFGFCHAFSIDEGGFSGRELFGGSSTVPLTIGTWFVGCDAQGPDGFYRSEETQVVVAEKGDVSLDVTLVKSIFDIPEGISTSFDMTQQATMQLPDGGSLTFPSNALGNEGNATVTATPQTNIFHTKDTKPLTFAWDFEATDAQGQTIETFNSNVTMCLKYDQEVVDAEELDETNLVAKFFDETSNTWKLPDGVTQDVENDTICMQVNHFTNFAVASNAAVTVAAASGPAAVLTTPASNGGPQVVIADENGNVQTSFFAYAQNLRTGVEAATGDVDGDGAYEIVTAPGAGAGPQVMVFDQDGTLLSQFFAYDMNMRSGIHVRVADLNGDGTAEIITSPMAGAGPQVRVFDRDGNAISQFFAYDEGFRGGITVETGDVSGDGITDLVTVPDSDGGPQVRVFDPTTAEVSAQFNAFASTLRGGYNLAVGNVTGGTENEIVVTPKEGNGPQVAIFNGTGGLLGLQFAYASTFRGGVDVAIGDVDGDGDNEIVTTPASDSSAQVRVLEGDGTTVLSQFFAWDEGVRGAFETFVADLNGDGTNEIVAVPGAGMGPQVRTFDRDGNLLSQFLTHHPDFRGGLHVVPAR